MIVIRSDFRLFVALVAYGYCPSGFGGTMLFSPKACRSKRLVTCQKSEVGIVHFREATKTNAALWKRAPFLIIFLKASVVMQKTVLSN